MIVHCNGVNHTDQGTMSTCRRCGVQVVRRADGRRFTLLRYTTEAGNQRTTYSCYAGRHVCNDADAAEYQAAQAANVESGALCVGQLVVVARGRKAPQGTVGTITWAGPSAYGDRARVQPETGEAFFIAVKNLDTYRR